MSRKRMVCTSLLVATSMSLASLAARVPLASSSGAQTGNGAQPNCNASSSPSCAAAAAGWVGAWSASMIRLPAPANAVVGAQAAPVVSGQTLREFVRVGASGERVRMLLDNRYGTVPVRIDAASVGRWQDGSSVAKGSLLPIRFHGRAAAVIAAGATLISDPVALNVRAGDMLGISLYVRGHAEAQTWHDDPRSAQFIAGPGDRTRDPALPDARKLPGIAWLARVDVQTTAPTRAVVALGDSITNGFRASAGHAWADVLQDRLDAAGCPRAVLNAGIDGNQVAAAAGTFGLGEAMVSRDANDVFAVPGVRYVVLLGGINDIGLSTVAAHARQQATPTADALADPVIASQKKILDAARVRGLTVIGATVLPFEHTAGTYTDAGEAARQKLNAWIRGPAGFDAVIDFDKALRDPAQPTRLRARYDSGDHLHPGDTGYRAMAAAIPLRVFDCH